MYVPKHFDPADAAWCHALMARESFALLVSTGAEGLPFATHLPLLLDADRGPHGTIVGHLARANPHARLLAEAGTRRTPACPPGTTWRCMLRAGPGSSRSPRASPRCSPAW